MALSALVNNLGPGRRGELEQRTAERHIPLDVIKVELHGALVGKRHEQAADIELGAYFHEYISIILLECLFRIAPQDAVRGRVLESIRRKLDP
jgi:hypothetical protein